MISNVWCIIASCHTCMVMRQHTVTWPSVSNIPIKLDGIEGDYSEHFIITQLIIYWLTTSEAVNNETHWTGSDHNIHCIVVTFTTQYGWVLSSSVTTRLLECGYSFREGTQLGDHEIVKVLLHANISMIALHTYVASSSIV